MKQRYVVMFAVLSIFSILFPDESSCFGAIHHIAHWKTKGIVSGVKSSVAVGKGAVAVAKKSAILPIIGAKKALLLAPIAIPIAIGTKAILAAKLAVPMGIGAAIGAPIGALIGAKTGALKGALIGKAIIAAKLAIAKKVALKVAGVKAKIVGAKIGFIGKGMGAVGAAVASAGAKLSSFSTKLSGFTSSLTPSLPSFSLPSLPSLSTGKTRSGPSSLEYSLVVNSPITGFQTNKGSFYSNPQSLRRRREARPDAAPEPQGNAQQLLQLVRSQNAQQCLQRVICELSANPNSHGNDGIRFGRSLILLESQTDRGAAQQYRQAATAGTQLSSGQMCSQFYPTCAFESNEIIRIGNQMIDG